jgi:acyl-CoA dehydrogenase
MASRGCSSADRHGRHDVAAAAAALDLTSTYVKERKQFGRAIATFRRSAAADTYINKEAIKLTSWQAAWRLDTGKPATTQVSTAKYWAAQGGQDVLLAAHHLHGGVGVDRDYPLYRYFLLAKQMELDLGSETPTLMRLGAVLAETPVG